MQKTSFNSQWRFRLHRPAENRRTKIDEADWRVLDLPHDYSIEQDRDPETPSGVSNGFFPMGRAEYQKTFEAPEEWRGKKVLVAFEGVYMNAEVFLNENYLGRHPYGYTSFSMDLSPYLEFGQENRLKVVVDNAAQTNSRWYSGSGIYRPVWLLVGEPVHIPEWGVWVTTPEVSSEKATVAVEVTIQNDSAEDQPVEVRLEVFGPDQQPVGQVSGQVQVGAGARQVFQQQLEVDGPQLWSPDAPNLYRLESTLAVNGKQIDSESTIFGIRSIAYSAEQGFLLNGEPILMKGGCVHHDNGVLGATSYARAEERKVEIHKASGYNAIRCAHNPPSPSFLEACDRLGMLVMDEAFDCWRQGKNPYDYHLSFDDWWERDIESMVLRDRNHPSIVVWSIGNEVMERDGRSGGAQIARMLADKIRSLDATRPVTSAICGVWDDKRTWEDTDAVFEALDLAGYNYQLKQNEPDHERHPERIIFGTETFPLEAFDNWMSVLEHSYVIGDFVWTSLDYLGESGIGRQHYDADKKNFLGEYPWHQAYCGDLDLCGFKRPQSYYRDILWGVGKQYIAVHYPIPEGKEPIITAWGWPDVDANWTWPGKEGQVFRVDVYTAGDQVELFLNGESQGIKPVSRADKLIASFDVPYQPGELKAVSRLGEDVIAETVLKTAGAPAQLRLTPDRATLQADGSDLSYVTVEVLDEEGCLQPNASQNVLFTVKGAGEIVAVGSSNPITTESYRGNQRKAYRGRCLVVVKSNGQPGEIRLRAHADGLDSTEVVLQAQ